jgi:hypothetical protein
MALSDLILPTHEIVVGQGKFAVRGLSSDDVSWLMQEHDKELEFLIDAGKGLADMKLDDKDAVTGFLRAVVKNLPELSAAIIACASDDRTEGAVSNAKRLPLPVQLDALSAVGSLTFEAYGGLKKFVDDLKHLVGGVAKMKIDSPS